MIEVWYVIVSFTLLTFVVLDGLDIGAGILQHFVCETEAERRVVIAAIGPLWSWHEVWLVAFGGTLMVAFPTVLAVSFSGFYLALFLLLWALVVRGIAIEVGGHIADPLWRTAWTFAFVSSNVLLGVLIGVALGNITRGVPLDASGQFALSFFTNFSPRGHVGILDWYTISVAVFTLVAFMAHGANALVLKTENEIHDRSLRLAERLWKLTCLLLVVITIESWIVRPQLFPGMIHNPFAWVGIAGVFGGLAAVFTGLKGGHELRAVIGSIGFIASLMIAGAASVFPEILHSTLDPQNTLTAYRGAAPSSGLAIALVWWPIALIFSFGYFLFIYQHYSGKVRPTEDSQNPY